MSEFATKSCPECAEEVRAEARKCRFCGYRFDLGRTPAEPSRFGTWLSVFSRRRASAETPYDLLSQWGVELALDEPVGLWIFGRVTARHGYLVATDRRFLIFEGVGRRYRKLHEHALATVTEVQLASGGGLRITGGGYDVIVRGADAESATAFRDHVTAFDLARRARLPD